MPRPVCVRCGREMEFHKAGAVVQFNAFAAAHDHEEQGPYQQWHGDWYRCPGCQTSVVARYGDKPTWEHHHGRAEKALPDVIVWERRNV